MLADVAMALDPLLFDKRAGFEPDEWQRDVLRSTGRRMLLNCCRQSGKSTTVAILALHRALYEPSSLTLLLSPSERQSKELFRKVVDAYGATGRTVASQSETTLWLELAGGSRIVALPGREGTVRGFSGVDLLIIDEAARVSDDLYASVRPMLAVSGGTLIALSTPWGKRGWWYAAWEDDGADWERVRVEATECPRIAALFLEEERRSLPTLLYRSEYLCEFTDTIDAVFSSDDIRAALSAEVAPLFPTLAGPASPAMPISPPALFAPLEAR